MRQARRLSAGMRDDDDDCADQDLRRRQLLATALADKLQDEHLSEADRALLEAEFERVRDAVWEARQRIFDRDATGQDEEAYYERYALSGESYPRNDAGEFIGLM